MQGISKDIDVKMLESDSKAEQLSPSDPGRNFSDYRLPGKTVPEKLSNRIYLFIYVMFCLIYLEKFFLQFNKRLKDAIQIKVKSWAIC